jgi:hypothetical protein
MRASQVGPDPSLELFPSSRARSYRQDLSFGLVDIRRQLEPVEREERFESRVAHAFVPIYEGVVTVSASPQALLELPVLLNEA